MTGNIFLSFAFLVAIQIPASALAQTAPILYPTQAQAGNGQQAQVVAPPAGGMSSGSQGTFAGYVEAPAHGMMVGGAGAAPAPSPQVQVQVQTQTQADGSPAAVVQAGTDAQIAQIAEMTPPGIPALPPLSDGRVISADKIEGFNTAIEQNFPMTPDMTRRYRDIYEEHERALKERPAPSARVDAGLVTLEPGETPSEFMVAPGIASVIGFYDVTGQPWPIHQYVLGNGQDFQVVQLGENSNNVAITPLTRFGWTNLVIVLSGEAKPVVMRVGISEQSAHFRHDVQITGYGPNAARNTASRDDVVREAGSPVLLSALSGVDLPEGAKPINVMGVDARGWMVGDRMFLRTRHALLSPEWSASMSGPDGVRVYEMAPASVALFSVDGQITRADVRLP